MLDVAAADVQRFHVVLQVLDRVFHVMQVALDIAEHFLCLLLLQLAGEGQVFVHTALLALRWINEGRLRLER